MKRIEIVKLKSMAQEKFVKSGKKHLIITGSIGIGKTTLLNEILKELSSVSGIRTWLDIIDEETGMRDIVLSEIGENTVYRVASWNGERMEIIEDFFETTGSLILEEQLVNNSEIFLMDEVGPLEGKSPKFMKLLSQIFETKRVFAIMKKRASALNQILETNTDYFLIDLDDFYTNIPYETLIKNRITGKFNNPNQE